MLGLLLDANGLLHVRLLLLLLLVALLRVRRLLLRLLLSISVQLVGRIRGRGHERAAGAAAWSQSQRGPCMRWQGWGNRVRNKR